MGSPPETSASVDGAIKMADVLESILMERCTRGSEALVFTIFTYYDARFDSRENSEEIDDAKTGKEMNVNSQRSLRIHLYRT